MISLTFFAISAQAQEVNEVIFQSVSPPPSSVRITSGNTASVSISGTVAAKLDGDTVIIVTVTEGNTQLKMSSWNARVNSKTDYVYNDPHSFAFSVPLAPGKHALSVNASTYNGGGGTLTFPVTILPSTPLAVAFSSPTSDQTVVVSGTSSRFSLAGNATPPTSDMNVTNLAILDNGTQLRSVGPGSIGAALSISMTADLALGTHILTLTASDSGGETVTATRTITVNSTSTPTPTNPGTGTSTGTTQANAARIMAIINELLLSDDDTATQTPPASAPPSSDPSSPIPIPVAVTVNELAYQDAGSLPGNLGVDNAGGSTYSVDMAVPPGTAGMQPTLALNYSSNGNNGMVGLGWSINGLSTIHRCPQTIAQDGNPGRIGFDSSDRLCLDGIRLLRYDGTASGDANATYWANPNGAQYRTEIEGFTRVTRLANGGFKVELKDGRVQYYGTDANSAISATGRTDGQSLLWALGRTEDRSGNYMTVEYSQDSTTGEYLPKQIRYGGNTVANQIADLAVRFSYEDRPDEQIQYMGGSRNDLRERLTNVLTYIGTNADGTGGTRVRDYIIRYTNTTNSGRSLIDSVQVCGATDAECLPRTSMTWGNFSLKLVETKEWKEPVNGDNETFPLKYVSGNFVGDGTNIALYPLQGVVPGASGRTYFLTNFSGQQYFAHLTYPNSTDRYSEAMSADFNGDGRDDLVLIDTGSRKWAYCLAQPNDGTTLNFSACQVGPTPLPTRDGTDDNPNALPTLVSLRNDGKAQLLAFDASNNLTICSFDSSMKCTTSSSVLPAGLPVLDVVPVDLSKQGMTDFYSTWMTKSGKSGITKCNYYNNQFSCKNLNNGDLSVANNKTNPSDLNGDGLTDFVYTGTNASGSAQQRICLSTEVDVDCNSVVASNSFGNQYYLMPLTGNLTGDGVNYFPGASPSGGSQSGVTSLCHIVGLTTVCQPIDVSAVPDLNNKFGYPAEDMATPVIADRSGIPSFRLCTIPYYVTNQYFHNCVLYSAVMSANQDKLVAVVNGVGQREEADYARGDDTTVYSAFATVNGAEQRPVYPQLANNAGVLVKQLRRSNGQGGWLSSTYRYAGAMLDGYGRGSLGFTTTSVTDSNGVIKDSVFAQAFPFVGMATHVTRHTTSCTLEDTVNALDAQSFNLAAGGQNFFVYMKQIDTARHDLDCSDLGSVQTINQYTDGWGNLNTQTVTTKGNGDTFVSKTQSDFYISSGANYLSGLPTNIAVTQSSSRTGSLTRTVSYAYNATTGLLDTETVEPSNAQYTIVTSYDRTANLFGLVNKVTKRWTNPACADGKWPSDRDGPCTSTVTRTISDTTFEAKGRFPYTVKNARGHAETLSYDAGSGVMTKRIDPNKLVTNWRLNGFGRVTAMAGPDGNEARSYMKACAGNCPNGATVAQVTTHYHGSLQISTPEVTYVDSAGHVVRKQNWSFDGRAVITDQRYDPLGRPWETDWPRFANAPAYLSARQGYDDLNRVTAITSVDEGGTERISKSDFHGFNRVLTNAKQQVKTERRDVIGQLHQVDDSNSPVGTTSFEYDPFGNVAKTTDPSLNVITVGYDLLGRRMDLQDPDLGAIHYDVDPVGQVWAQTSPNQTTKCRTTSVCQKTYMAYDELGRMSARYETDLESHWVYDTATTGIGVLAQAYTRGASTPDYSRTQTYDSVGRPKLSSTVLSDATYTSQVDYDDWGRVITNTYQRGSDVAKVFGTRYNNIGYMARIQRGSLALWQATAADAANRPTTIVLGNGLTRSSAFYPQTERLWNGSLATGAGAMRLQEGYTYDELGNVSNRTQYWDAGGFSEDFHYDSLNRLHTSQVQGQALQTFEYDATGNIQSKTGVGTYGYSTQGAGSIRPHAVQSVSSVSGTFHYDGDGNMLDGAGRTATWNSFDMPIQLTKGSSTSSFVYGPEHQRVRQDRNDGTVIVYAGAQEVEKNGNVVSVKTYWPNGIGVEIDRGSNATEMSWMHVDRLGSVIALTDQNGSIRTDGKLEYDVWGKRRSTVDNTNTADSIDGKIDNRGFTGHEMLDQLDLVHMNGRVYDPWTAKFISGDPPVQDPANGQNYNRYSYVLNNPANTIDPTGFVYEPIGNGSVCGIGRDCVSISLGDNQGTKNGKDEQQRAHSNSGSATNRAGGNTSNSANNGANSQPADKEYEHTVTQDPLFPNEIHHDAREVKPVPDRASPIVGQMIGIAANGIPLERPFVWGYRGVQMWRAARAAQKVGKAYNVAGGARLAEQLTLESARSPFNAAGELTEEAINASKPVPNLGPGQLSNPNIPNGLGKYTTETFQSPAGSFQVHFYMNPETGEAFYGLDYKAIFNSMSGVAK